VCPEIAKTSAIGVSLACLIGKSYDFAGFGVVQEVFRAEFEPKMRFGCMWYNLMHYSGSQVSAVLGAEKQRVSRDTRHP
jgi:hypothetical protein